MNKIKTLEELEQEQEEDQANEDYELEIADHNSSYLLDVL